MASALALRARPGRPPWPPWPPALAALAALLALPRPCGQGRPVFFCSLPLFFCSLLCGTMSVQKENKMDMTTLSDVALEKAFFNTISAFIFYDNANKTRQRKEVEARLHAIKEEYYRRDCQRPTLRIYKPE